MEGDDRLISPESTTRNHHIASKFAADQAISIHGCRR
jgi:hypothetical protein